MHRLPSHGATGLPGQPEARRRVFSRILRSANRRLQVRLTLPIWVARPTVHRYAPGLRDAPFYFNELHVHDVPSALRCVNLVILPMRSNEADVGNLPVVVHGNHEPIVATFDVENYAISCQKTSIAIGCFNVRRRASQLPDDGFALIVKEAAAIVCLQFGDDFQQPFGRELRRLQVEPGLRERR